MVIARACFRVAKRASLQGGCKVLFSRRSAGTVRVVSVGSPIKLIMPQNSAHAPMAAMPDSTPTLHVLTSHRAVSRTLSLRNAESLVALRSRVAAGGVVCWRDAGPLYGGCKSSESCPSELIELHLVASVVWCVYLRLCLL